MLIVAIMSPLLSSIADYKGNKKKFMNFFLTMGSVACAMLFFFNTALALPVAASPLGLGIICMIIACVGFGGARFFIIHFFRK